MDNRHIFEQLLDYQPKGQRCVALQRSLSAWDRKKTIFGLFLAEDEDDGEVQYQTEKGD